MTQLLFPFKTLFNLVFFPPNGVVRVVSWSIMLILVLFLSSAVSWQLGYQRYYYQGQPNDYTSNNRMRGNYQLLNSFSSNRQEGNLLDVGYYLGEPVAKFAGTPYGSQWTLQENGSYNFYDTEIRMVVEKSSEDFTHSYKISAPGFDENLASSLMMRIRSRWSFPKLIQNPWKSDPLTGDQVAWWTDDFILEINWKREQLVPYREKELILELEALGKMHPNFVARKGALDAALKAQTP